MSICVKHFYQCCILTHYFMNMCVWLTSTCLSTSLKGSIADCISSEWKAPLTGRGLDLTKLSLLEFCWRKSRAWRNKYHLRSLLVYEECLFRPAYLLMTRYNSTIRKQIVGHRTHRFLDPHTLAVLSGQQAGIFIVRLVSTNNWYHPTRNHLGGFLHGLCTDLHCQQSWRTSKYWLAAV